MASLSDWIRNPSRVFFIAEAGVNHNGDVKMALELVEAAAEAKADAVKFQTFSASALVTATAAKASYQQRNDYSTGTQAEMLRALELGEQAWVAVYERCRQLGISFLSTPFDPGSADFLEELGVDAYKISSGDLTYIPLLAHVAKKKRPIVISTGMATLSETEDAVRTIEANGAPPLAILHCVSDYPSDPADSNLRVLKLLKDAFGYPVGWSDHTLGYSTGLASVALGAMIIEKHFTLSTSLPGPDHKASMEPEELRRFVCDIRVVESSLGTGRKQPTPAEMDTALVARRSVVLLKDTAAGEALTLENCGALRPGTGFPPKMLEFIVGKRLTVDLPAGTILNHRHLN